MESQILVTRITIFSVTRHILLVFWHLNKSVSTDLRCLRKFYIPLCASVLHLSLGWTRHDLPRINRNLPFTAAGSPSERKAGVENRIHSINRVHLYSVIYIFSIRQWHHRSDLLSNGTKLSVMDEGKKGLGRHSCVKHGERVHSANSSIRSLE